MPACPPPPLSLLLTFTCRSNSNRNGEHDGDGEGDGNGNGVGTMQLCIAAKQLMWLQEKKRRRPKFAPHLPLDPPPLHPLHPGKLISSFHNFSLHPPSRPLRPPSLLSLPSLNPPFPLPQPLISCMAGQSHGTRSRWPAFPQPPFPFSLLLPSSYVSTQKRRKRLKHFSNL